MRILIVEDSETLSEALNRSLRIEGYACDIAADGQAALQFLKSYRYDAIILDLMLPRVDGFGVLQALGSDAGAAPVLVLSAREQLDDRVRALDAGADDYLTKPFELAELEARLAALHRRSQGRAQPQVECGSLRYDGNHGTFWLADAVLSLTPREHAALEGLVARIGAPVGKARLAAKVFPQESAVGPDAIEQVLHRLRRKLAGSDVHIVTVRGLGYMLEPTLNPLSGSLAP